MFSDCVAFVVLFVVQIDERQISQTGCRDDRRSSVIAEMGTFGDRPRKGHKMSGIKIVSGGQTGVDQGALEAAVALGRGLTFGVKQYTMGYI